MDGPSSPRAPRAGGGRRSTVAGLCLGLTALTAAWRFDAPAHLPLYDGPVVVAPYLYVCVPPGYNQSRAPQPKSQSYTVTGGHIDGGGIFLGTDEPPVSQAQVLIADGTLQLPAGATEITATITPEQPPSSPPPDGALDGNVYSVAVTSGGKPVPMLSGKTWTVVLRGETGKPTSVVEQYAGGGWHHALLDEPAGAADVYAANFSSFGSFALVTPGAQSTQGECHLLAQSGASTSSGGDQGSGGGSGILPIVAVVGGLLLVAGGLIFVRSRR